MAKISSISFWLFSGLLIGEAIFANVDWKAKVWVLVIAIFEFVMGVVFDREARKLTITDHWARGRGLTVKLKNGVVLDLTEVPDGKK